MAMGDFDPVRKISELDLSDTQRALVLGDNAKIALNI
jgi:hypothetical protein